MTASLLLPSADTLLYCDEVTEGQTPTATTNTTSMNRTRNHHEAQAYSSPQRHHRRRWSRNEIPLWLMTAIAILPWCFFALPYQWQLATLRQALEGIKVQQFRRARELQLAANQLRKLQDQNHETTSVNDHLMNELHKHGDYIRFDSDVYEKAEAVEETMFARIDSLELVIQQHSALLVRNKYGPGPYRVEMILQEGSHQNDQPASNHSSKEVKIVLMTAPLDSAPHALHYFLKSIDLKLWDGLTMVHASQGSSILHSTSIVQGRGTWDEDRFAKANLTSLAFLEHPEETPLGKYSVVLSGHGPHFYIVTNDLLNPDEINEQETCFARLIHGQEALDGFLGHQASRLALMLGIKSMRILS